MDQSFKDKLFVLLLHLRTSQLLVQEVMNHPDAQGRQPGVEATPEQQIGHRVKEVFQKADWFVGKSLQLLGDPDFSERVQEADSEVTAMADYIKFIADNPGNPDHQLKELLRLAFKEGLDIGQFNRGAFEQWYGRIIPQTKIKQHEPVR